MLSKEEIEQYKEEQELSDLSNKEIADEAIATLVKSMNYKEDGFRRVEKVALLAISILQNDIEQLETNNKKLIEKLEDLINNKFRAFFEGNTEFPDNATEMKIVKYIKATDLEEILKIAKGEKE